MTGAQITFHRLDPELPSPQRAHWDDAGFDLVAAREVTVEPGERASVPTGLAVAIPPGHAGMVLPRSGHAARHGIGLVNAPGLIDPGYRGEIRVLIINHGTEAVTFERGDRIAQFVVVRLPEVEWIEADVLPISDRGKAGFGSTGR